MNQNPLDLNQLTMEDIDFSDAREGMERLKRLEKEYQEKYGDDWWEHYLKDTNPYHDMDLDEETINRAIYEGHRLCMTGHPQTLKRIEDRYWEKMKRLFGLFYKQYITHEPNDPKVNKALLKDAVKTGLWKELPINLQTDYQKMIGK